MTRYLVILGVSTALVTAIRPGNAQVSGRVDAVLGGGPALQVKGMESHWAIASGAHYLGSRLRLDADGEYRTARETVEANVSVAAAHFTALRPGVLVEVAGAARGRTGAVGMTGIVWDLGGRMHLNGTRRGGWLGLGAGRDLRGVTSRWEAAAWRRFGRISVQLSGSQTAAVHLIQLTTPGQDTLTPAIDTTTAPRVRVTTDLGAWLRWAPAHFDLALGMGRRYGAPQVALSPSLRADVTPGGQPGTTQTTVSDWWLAEGTYWLTRRLGVNAAIGQSPPDREFATPGGRFLRLAVRATFGREATRAPIPAHGAAGIRLHRDPDGQVLLELVLAGSTVRHVELMGDFTDWQPIELREAGAGRWRLGLRIPAGIHHVNVRYDGGPWQPPPGTSVVTDDFGQLTGVLVVE